MTLDPAECRCGSPTYLPEGDSIPKCVASGAWTFNCRRGLAPKNRTSVHALIPKEYSKEEGTLEEAWSK